MSVGYLFFGFIGPVALEMVFKTPHEIEHFQMDAFGDQYVMCNRDSELVPVWMPYNSGCGD